MVILLIIFRGLQLTFLATIKNTSPSGADFRNWINLWVHLDPLTLVDTLTALIESRIPEELSTDAPLEDFQNPSLYTVGFHATPSA